MTTERPSRGEDEQDARPPAALRTPRSSLRRTVLLFMASQLVVLPLVFGDAMLGRSLLAPIDIPPALFPKYSFVDPAQSPIPANHFVIDGVAYDLPIQRTVYAAYQRGELPWWDPYTLGGRPLLADAHINATDFVRVAMYHALPFELAFNWTRILHFVIGGLGALLLLRHFGFSTGVAVGLAVAFEFSGGFVMTFSHPWIQASFLFYPFLWMLWDGAWSRAPGWRDGAAAVVIAGVLYSGNLQSHAYLALFALAFLLGYCGVRRFDCARWTRGLRVVLPSAVAGACLAAPVLLHQLELYAVGVQLSNPLRAGGDCVVCTSGVFSLSAVYPWVLGTFRTLDIGKLAGESALGFIAYPGSVVVCLAALGLFFTRQSRRPDVERTAAWLLAIYFLVILSTPLKGVFYSRSSGLALIAFPVLAAFMLERLERGVERRLLVRRFAVGVLTATVAMVTALHVVAFLIYPAVIDRVRAFVLGQVRSVSAEGALRSFQVENFPREVTFINPEALLAAAALIALGVALLRASLHRRRWVWALLLALNVAPMLLFARRFIPRHPVEMWHRLEAGGPEQNRVRAAMRSEERLFDSSPHEFAQLFPFALPHLYGIRAVHGYAALQPDGIASPRRRAEADRLGGAYSDWTYHSPTHSAQGDLQRTNANRLARFYWRTGTGRELAVLSDGSQRIELTVGAGDAGELVWTDSPYPGWRATIDGRAAVTRHELPFETVISVPAGARQVVLRYEPTYLRVGIALALAGALAVVFLTWRGTGMPGSRREKTHLASA